MNAVRRVDGLHLSGMVVVLLAATGLVSQFSMLPAQAQGPLLEENFDYGEPAGSLREASGGNWTRFNGDINSPVGYQPSSLEMAGYVSSGIGGSATIFQDHSEDVQRVFDEQTTGDVYYAALVNLSSATQDGTYFLSFRDTGTDHYRGLLFAQDQGGHLRFGISGSDTNPDWGDEDFAYGSTYLVVAKYDASSGDSALYVLDTFSPTEPTSTLAAETQTETGSPVSAVAIRQATVTSSPAGTIDGIRVGTTWADAVGQPSLDVSKSAPEMVPPETVFTYTLVVTNNTGSNTPGTVLTDTVPANVTYVEGSASDEGTVADGIVSWQIGNLDNGEDVSRTFRVTATSTIGVDVVNDEYAVHADNWATPAFGSPVTTTIQLLDLGVTETGPDIVLGGRDAVYTISLQNRGLTEANDTVLTDTLPVSVTYKWDDSEWLAHTCTVGAHQVVTWSVGSVPTNTNYTFNLTATVDAEVAQGTLTNEVAVGTQMAGDDPRNNTASWETSAYPLVSIATARGGNDGDVFAIEGRVIYLPGTYNGNSWGLQDDSGGITVYYSPPPSVQLGDLVDLVAARHSNNGEEQMVSPLLFANLGNGPEVDPLPYSTGDVAAGDSEGWLVVVTGTVSGLDDCSSYKGSFYVDDETGPAYIYIDGDTGIDVCSMGFTDSDFVRIVGYSTEYKGSYQIKPRSDGDVWRRPTGFVASKSAPGTAVQGSVFTYTLEVRNDVGATATGVVITDALPLSVTISSISDGGIELGGNVVSWTIPSLAQNAVVTREVAVTVPSSLETLVNSDYRVWATEYVTRVLGSPVTTHVVQRECSICAVQGYGDVSPYAGQVVSVTGVIYDLFLVGGPSNLQHGFFMQAKAGTEDGDPATSDGIYVYLDSATTIGGYTPAVGDEISLQGKVADSSGWPSYGMTLLREPFTLTVNLGPVGDLDTAVPPAEITPTGTVEQDNAMRERVEGMRVEVQDGSLIVAPTHMYASSSDTEFYVIRGDHPVALRSDPFERRVFRDPHPLDNEGGSGDDGNPYRISVEANVMKGNAGDYSVQLPRANVYDVVTNDLVGPMYYGYGRYTLMVEDTPLISATARADTNSPPQAADRDVEYSVATLNSENLYDYFDDPFDGCDFAGDAGCPDVSEPFDYVPADQAAYQTHLTKLAGQVLSAMQSPDIVAIEEAEDQDVCVDGGQVYGTCDIVDDADGLPDVLQDLAEEIRIQSGDTITYQVALDREGTDYRGIVVGFLYRADRVELVSPADLDSDPVLGLRPSDPYASDYPHNTEVLNPKALQARASSDAQADGQGADLFERLPQVALFRVHRSGLSGTDFIDVYLVGHHFKSSPDTYVQRRTEQAAYNDQLVADIEDVSPEARVAVLGDLNVYPDSDQLAALGNRANNLFYQIPPASRYSYVYDGQSQTLDQIFVTDVLSQTLVAARVAHVNADWSYEYQDDDTTIYHATDHDPVVATFLLPKPADLSGSVKKVDPPGDVSAGDLLTYTVILSNTGEVDAAATITDELPAELLLVEGLDGGDLTWSGVVTAGDQVTLTLAVQADPALTANATVSNVATIDDGVHAPFEIHSPDTTILVPDLSISKEVTPNQNLGFEDVVTYTITLQNSGDGMAAGTTMADDLPTGVTFGGWVEQNGASQAGGTLTWSGDIPAGGEVELVFTAAVDADPSLYGETITNTASFTSDNAGSGSSDAGLQVGLQPADLTGSFKEVAPSGDVNAGELLTYTIVLSNSGGVDAAVTVTDILPAELAMVEGLDGAGLTWSGVVTAGKKVTLTLVAQADPTLAASATVSNVATIDDGVHAPFDVASPDTTILVPGLSIAKEVTPDAAVALRGVVTYTIILYNSGDGSAAGVVMTDDLPAGVTFGGWVEQNGASETNDTLTWTGDIAAGGGKVFVFTATVDAEPALYGGTITNIASFVSGNAGNGSDDAALSIEKVFRIYVPIVLKNG